LFLLWALLAAGDALGGGQTNIFWIIFGYGIARAVSELSR